MKPNEDYAGAWERMVDNAMRSNNYIDRDQGIIYGARRIAELEAENAKLREAAAEVVSWDWLGLKSQPYHVDWLNALTDIRLMEQVLLEKNDE